MASVLYYATVILFLANLGLAKDEIYDFIVAGIGSAGSVLINRLSSNTRFTVLGLETGGHGNLLSHIPGVSPIMYYTENNYRYKMQPQPNMALGLEDGQVSLCAGKGLGGSSLINMMMHVIPHREDFDNWARLGNVGWNSVTMLKYLREIENAHIPNPNTYYRGINGSLDCQEIPFRTGGVYAFLQASKEMGMEINPDYNGEKQQEGAAYLQGTLRNGMRCDAFTAFGKPIKKRQNLKIRIFSKVVRILIDPNTKRAIGVVYFQTLTFRYKNAYARKEVILSSGVYNSPKLLMLSGIGPKEDLESFGINVTKDLRVGKFFEDHVMFPGILFTAKKRFNGNIFAIFLNPLNYYKFFIKHTGIFTVPGSSIEAVSFINTNVSSKNSNLNDMELMFFSGSLSSDYGLLYRKFLRISRTTYKTVFKKTENLQTWMVIPVALRPKSHGYVTLKSKNPFDDPLIYGNYFTDERGIDMKAMIAAIRFCQKLSKTPAFKEIGTEQVIPELPGCKNTVLDSDEYWECFIRHIAMSLWHQVGTCKMGNATDSSAVVDSNLKVYGISGLRVIDNSIAPSVPGGHTNLLAMMIAFKGSDMILKEYS